MDYDKLIERLRKEAYGSDIEDLLLGASTAIETLWADLARVTAERNAAQALLAEISRATILYISLLKGGDILCHTQGRAFSIDEIGKTAFLAREEAEAALKAREALDDGNE